jgi:hypothetical protein
MAADEPTTRKGFFKPFLNFIFLLLVITPAVSAAPVVDFNILDVSFSLFLLLLFLSLAFLALGVFGGSPALATSGAAVLLLVGFLMLNGNVHLPSGETELVYGDVYNEDFYVNHNGTDKEGELNVMRERKVFNAWNDGNNAFIGWMVVIISTVLMFSIFDVAKGDA